MNRNVEPEPPDMEGLASAVRDAFAAPTPAALAAANVLTRLPAVRPAARRNSHLASLIASPRWQLVAAGLLLTVGLLTGLALGRSQGAAVLPTGQKIRVQIASLDGTVLVRHKGGQTWEPLQRGASLVLGDMLHSTGKSAVTLLLWERSSIRVNANTTLSADEFNGRVKFTLSSGTIKADLQSAHPPFFIHTPQGTLEALGTEFIVSVD